MFKLSVSRFVRLVANGTTQFTLKDVFLVYKTIPPSNREGEIKHFELSVPPKVSSAAEMAGLRATVCEISQFKVLV